MNWAINNTLDVCKGAIAPGTEYAEIYLEEVWNAAKQSSTRIKGDAAKRGTNLHAAIERSIRESGELQSGDTEVLELRDWLQRDNITITESERKIYSRRHRYSGTLDAIGTIGEKIYLLDWKTGKSVYPEFRLQTAAYQYAWEEEHPDQPIQGRYIVRILEDGSIDPHYYPRDTYRLDFKAFIGAKALFDRVRQIEKELRKSSNKT